MRPSVIVDLGAGTGGVSEWTDAVVMFGVTSLMDDIVAAIAEVDRLLTWSGRFAIADLFSATEESWRDAPNVFRSIEDLTRTLDRQGFTMTDIGFGDRVPDPSWAAAAQAVDDWIPTHCTDRRRYREWMDDRRHLRRHVDAGGLLGECVVAQRTPVR